jgi:hypothetical protein
MSGRDAHLATLRLKRKQLRLSWCGLGHRLMSDHLDPQGGLALAVDFGSPRFMGDLASSNMKNRRTAQMPQLLPLLASSRDAPRSLRPVPSSCVAHTAGGPRGGGGVRIDG